MIPDVSTCLLTTETYRDLALYSHAIPAAATLVLGIFTFVYAADRRKASIFFAFTLALALWLICDLVNWLADDYHIVAATWAPLDFLEITAFLTLLVFVIVDLFPRAPRWIPWAAFMPALPPLALTFAGQAVHEMYHAQCEMLGNEWLAEYKFDLSILLFATIVAIGGYHMFRAGIGTTERIRATIVAGSIALFMLVFAGAEYYSTQSGIYEVTLYSLFALPLFILALTISIISFQTLRLGDVAVKMLFYVFLILAGTEFFYVQDMTDFWLAAMSFFTIGALGLMLFRTNEREIDARHRVEKQEEELAIMNAQQANLLHFISHEVKGTLNKAQGVFAGMTEGDYGALPEQLRTIAANGLREVRSGIGMVMDILDASNLKKGTVSFTKTRFDLRDIVEKIVDDERSVLREKGLEFSYTAPSTGPLMIEGDAEKLEKHVLRNVIENARHYTLQGFVRVALVRAGSVARLTVEDSGIGIAPEDMAHLFTEGGKGKESTKVNVNSTGYGLFIAKQVIEAHGGTVRAESEGVGKGSRFVVELPLA